MYVDDKAYFLKFDEKKIITIFFDEENSTIEDLNKLIFEKEKYLESI